MNIPRLTRDEIVALMRLAPGKSEVIYEQRNMDELINRMCEATETMQVFDFGRVDKAVPVDRELSAELWHRKLLRPPFPVTFMTFLSNDIRISMLIIADAMIEVGAGTELTQATAFVLFTQGATWARPDAFVWFDTPNGTHVSAGATELTDCPDETPETFQGYTLAAISRIMTLCMFLNTKGVRARHEPVPVRLNKKRIANGKPPLSAVTYVDVSDIKNGHSGPGKGGEKSMHLRRGHIRHFDDGSITWVRDAIIKAGGDLKQRERYQVINTNLENHSVNH